MFPRTTSHHVSIMFPRFHNVSSFLSHNCCSLMSPQCFYLHNCFSLMCPQCFFFSHRQSHCLPRHRRPSTRRGLEVNGPTAFLSLEVLRSFPKTPSNYPCIVSIGTVHGFYPSILSIDLIHRYHPTRKLSSECQKTIILVSDFSGHRKSVWQRKRSS